MTKARVAARDAAAGGFGANPRACTRLHRDGTCLLRDFPVADISEYLTDAASVVWLDLCRPTAATRTWSIRSSGGTNSPSPASSPNSSPEGDRLLPATVVGIVGARIGRFVA